MKANFTPSQKGYKNITPFKLFVIEQFPFIEANFDAITEWQLLQKIGEKLNEIILNTTNVTDNTKSLYNAYVALEKYVNDYFDNLDVQDEINIKLNEMAEDGSLLNIVNNYLNILKIYNTTNEMLADNNLINGQKVKTLGFYNINDGGGALYNISNIKPAEMLGVQVLNNGLYAILNEKNINPKMFGASNSKEINQSQYIIDTINYCFNNNIKTLDLKGNYFINSKMEFSEKSNLIIKNGLFYVNETNELLNNNFNVLSFLSCNNITLDNVQLIELNPSPRNRNLYVGGLYFNNCSNCNVLNCYIENTQSGIILFNHSKNCLITNNTINVNYHYNQFAQSAILNYASSQNIIKNNKITGEFYDGSLSVYGGGSNDVLVDSNIIKNIFDENTSYLSEGITIDAATNNVTVSNNTVYDMYYGIDNKHDAKNTLIINNTLIGNKISIADRPGEEDGQTFNCQIKNNNIVFKKDFDTNNLGTTLFDGFFFIGIYISSRLSADIKNNKFSCFESLGGLSICGIYAKMSTTSTSNYYLSQFDITNNTIEFATGFGSITSSAGNNSVGIKIVNVKKGLISANSFKCEITSNHYDMILLDGSNSHLLITNNLCFTTSSDNHYFINVLDNFILTNSKIINNKLTKTHLIPNLQSITNEIEQERFNIKAHQIKTTSLIENTWTTVAKFSLKYAGILHLKLKSLLSNNGDRYINAEYVISLNNLVVKQTEIINNSYGIDFQFINDGVTNNSVLLQIKTPEGINVNQFISLFIYELISTQDLTLSDV